MGDEYLTDRAGDAVLRIHLRSGDLREVLQVVDDLFDGSAEVGAPVHWKNNYTVRKYATLPGGIKVLVSCNTQEFHFQFTVEGAEDPYFSDYIHVASSHNWDDLVEHATKKLLESLTEGSEK